MSATTDRNFVLQQGLDAPSAAGCEVRASALLFQPRVIGLVLIAGVIVQSPVLFAALAAVLWWCALVPRANLFDLVYNVTFGGRTGASRLGPAPAPRRFAQALAGAFAAATAAALWADVPPVAWIFEGLLALAIAALVFLRFCFGSFLYHVLRGRTAFALSTLPWARDPASSEPAAG